MNANNRSKDQVEDPNPRKRPNNGSVENSVPAKAMNVERFDLASKADENSWESKFDLAEYAIKQMNTYIADTDIKDEIYLPTLSQIIYRIKRTWTRK